MTTTLLDILKERVLLADGGMGTALQDWDLDLEKDFLGKENCSEVLVQTRPDVVRDIHTRFFEAGSDMVETNTFGGTPITLGEFDLQDSCLEINRTAVQLAREAADRFSDGRQRYVIGSVGPGTKLPSLGHIDYDTLEAGYQLQGQGLFEGGVDVVLVETCQDPLQIKAAVNGMKAARKALGKEHIPIMTQVTVETTGTMLVGTDIAAAGTVLKSLDIPIMGLNCATGPQEMSEHIKWMSENWPGMISVLPNAGLPELLDGRTHYPLKPEELARWHQRFIQEDGVNIVGGCCGTTHHHMAAVDAMLREIGNGDRPKPVKRTVHWVPAVASLYGQVPLRQENAILSIGERCNANGSKKFREAQGREDWDACLAIARDQVKEGSHTLDLCCAFVGRDEMHDMTEMVTRMRGGVTPPLVIDSTETPVIEAALKLYGGKPIINSINFEDGEGPAADRLQLARKYGGTVIALTIDEEGMAKTAERKLEIAKRLYDFAVNQHGLPPEDLMFDPLTFTVCTGNEDDRGLAIETLNGIKAIREAMPECQIMLGLSNISFGLKPAARHVLNSVFLDHAQKHGMTAAIIHVSKIKPLHAIPPEEVKAAEDLIFDRRAEGYDPLQELIRLFMNKDPEAEAARKKPTTIEEKLKERIVDGDRKGLEEDLDEALKTYEPLFIINDLLLGGMKVVGELFGAGKMQLPFVLQAAETMKASVSYLENFMEKKEGQHKGTLVLATVKGDVHDIGKNLVDIILTNNGYRVVNLGIKQPVNTIIEAARNDNADAVGMSGLLVKSTVIMRENLEEMVRAGLDVPVLLGGAALTRAYVEGDCADAYTNGNVAYARDAFDGLTLMDHTMAGTLGDHLQQSKEKRPQRQPRQEVETAQRPVDAEETRIRRQELAAAHDVPTPPFWGAKLLEKVNIKSLVPYLNETMLFQFQWGFRKAGKSREEFLKWADEEVRPILHRMLKLGLEEELFQPQAAYGYWKAAGEGNDLILFEEDGTTELARFTLPRQNREEGLCVADFFRDVSAPERDVVGMQVVTMGTRPTEVAQQWFKDDRYQDYLYLHGLSVELTEALAEYVHKRIRDDLGFGHEDARDMQKLLKQGYRGSRYSFGYPACPNLEDQKHLLSLLGSERIGVNLTESWQLEPEQSTSALVVLHPQAKYFNI